MKTPLPEKIQGEIVKMGELEGMQMSVEASTVNQLIDCVAELTEVVEGKQTPTLKETLLSELKNKSNIPWDYYHDIPGDTVVVNWSDVEAIINRLIP